MGLGDIKFSQATNAKCVIEQADGTMQRAIHVAIGNTDINTAYLNVGQAFFLKVKQGLVPGHSTVSKFGVNPEISPATDPEDVWHFGGIYTYDADGTAPIVSLISDDAGDTQEIIVQGLDINGDETSQTLTLTGTTRVALTTPLWRVFRMWNNGTTDIAGTVYCYTGTGGVPAASAVRATISGDHNQTLIALYTIPNGKVGFLHRLESGVELEGNAGALAEYAHVHLETRKLGKVFRIKKSYTNLVGGSANYLDLCTFPNVFVSQTDIKMRVVVVTQTMGVWGAFDILLVDEDLFPDSYLTSIGQPGY